MQLVRAFSAGLQPAVRWLGRTQGVALGWGSAGLQPADLRMGWNPGRCLGSGRRAFSPQVAGVSYPRGVAWASEVGPSARRRRWGRKPKALPRGREGRTFSPQVAGWVVNPRRCPRGREARAFSPLIIGGYDLLWSTGRLAGSGPQRLAPGDLTSAAEAMPLPRLFRDGLWCYSPSRVTLLPRPKLPGFGWKIGPRGARGPLIHDEALNGRRTWLVVVAIRGSFVRRRP